VNRLSITASLVLLILAAALPVMALLAWSTIEQRNGVIERAEDQLLRSARLLAAQQQGMFTNARDLLNTLTVAATEIGVDNPACGTLASRIASQNTSYEALAIAEPDGNVVCRSSSEGIGDNLSNLDVFASAIASPEMAIGIPSNGTIPVAVSARAGSGDAQLVAVGMLRFAELEGAMSLSRLPSGGIGILFDAERNILAMAPTDVEIEPDLLEAVTPSAAPSFGGGGLVDLETSSGDRFMWAVADFLPEQGMFVAVGIDYRDLVADDDRNLWRSLGLLVVVFLLAASTAWIVGQRTIQRPIERLATAVTAMRHGNREPGVVTGPGREFRQLGSDFDEMAEALRQREADLKERSDRLAQLAKERETLVQEMNHRVRNSLQLVSSIVGLQIGNISDATARERLQEAQSRITAISRVHEQLYAGVRPNQVSVKRYLNDLAKDLAASLALEERSISLAVDAADFELPPDKVIPLGMIVSELVTNSAKHAISEGSGEIGVSARRNNGEVVIAITDPGAGLPSHRSTTGLGLKIVDALTEQLEAVLETKSFQGGSQTSIRFPNGSD